MTAPSHFGRYRVLRPLATGEMGLVYLAEDPIIGRKLAIKGIRFDPCSDDDEIQRLQQRFAQEIQIAGTFSHPNIVTLYDVGEQNGCSFIAMEYVDGRNLRAELQASAPMPADRVIPLAVPLCRALAYAHERNIVHRDIKPTNILVSSEGVPKITDFGVARLCGSTMTHAGKIFGTPAYMSPEQALGGELDGRSDQFALCTVLYELLTGERPFTGTSAASVIYQVLEHEPPPPHEIAPRVPTAVSEIVMRGLDKNPNQRYASCAELADALTEALAWSRANPELAHFDDRPLEPEVATPQGVAGWRAALSDAGGRAAEWLATGVNAPGAEKARSASIGTAQRSGRLAVMTGGALGLMAAVTAVAWAAGVRGPLTELTAATIGDSAAAAMIGSAAGSLPDRDRGVSRGFRSHDLDSEAAPAAVPVTSTSTAEIIGALDGRPRVFAIASRPVGATVYFNGERLPETSPVDVSLQAGESYTIRVERDGYEASGWRFSLADLSLEHFRSGQLFFPLAPAAPATEAASEGGGSRR